MNRSIRPDAQLHYYKRVNLRASLAACPKAFKVDRLIGCSTVSLGLPQAFAEHLQHRMFNGVRIPRRFQPLLKNRGDAGGPVSAHLVSNCQV